MESQSEESEWPSENRNWSRKWSHKLDGVGVERIRTFPFSSDSAYDSIAYDPVKTRLLEMDAEAEAEAEEPTNHNAYSQAPWLQFDTKIVLATSTI